VNDNWHFVSDNGDGVLGVGDMVSNANDSVASGSLTLQYGTQAFGAVTTGAKTGSGTGVATIGDAVTGTSAGGTVNVLEGAYTENVTVNQSLTLAGANAGISAGLSPGTRGPETVLTGGIIVQASNVTIDGFTILAGVNVGEFAGVFLTGGATNVTIQNNILEGNGTGRGVLSTYGGGNDDLTVKNNEIFNWTTGVFNQTNTNVVVEGNSIHDTLAGVANDFVSGVLIQQNDFKDNGEAVGTLNSTGVVVTHNNLDDNTSGVNNYGGLAVLAEQNWWGSTAGPPEGYNTGAVKVTFVLPAPVGTATFSTWADASGNVLIVDTASGVYTLTLADGTSYSGSGARVQNGVLKIHDQSTNGKIDVKGSAGGALSIDVRGKAKKSFSLGFVA
jgi:Periplasmic copper-binding protein (NosD)